MLQLFNTLSGRKEEFAPLAPGIVRMYVCGDTVYDFCHIGHARSKIAFDVVRRYLEYRGYKVTFVRNITDIDDRIIERAAQNGEAIQALTARFTRAMHEDYDRLGILRPTHEPKATEHVQGIISMTQVLIDKGFAYLATNGDVLYSVSKFAPYGKLSGKRLEELRAGARVAVDEAKRDPADFVLWKRAKPNEPFWPSPWGDGRPGWHIECSAMSYEILGSRFDIHGGGADLKFPHHENEIAQSCAATGDQFAKYWMHNGFVNVDDEKMSKSLGNFFRIRDVIGDPDSADKLVRHPEVLRCFLLSSHYRGPINYSLVQIEQADAALIRIYGAMRDVPTTDHHERTGATKAFEEAMDDDFNTPEALAVLQSLTTEINRSKQNEPREASRLVAELRSLGAVLGILQLEPDEFLKARKRVLGAGALVAPEPIMQGTFTETPAQPETQSLPVQGHPPTVVAGFSDIEIERLKDERIEARRAKNFKRSDEIRKRLADAGIILEDKPDGTTSWRHK
jgi:cysteinyl-tRNA synthetase